MNAARRWLEAFAQVVIVYSLAILFFELEVGTKTYPTLFAWSEWVVGVVFTIEYVIRWVASRSWRYPLRPAALVDLLAVFPFYLWLFAGGHLVRVARVLRVFRVLKLDRQGEASGTLYRAYYHIRHEVRLTALGGLVVGLFGSVVIYELEREGQPQAFAHVSDASWYILATVTTVGYGDKVPKSDGGRLVGGMVMLSGLVLFGTFVSLVGSSFVEEIRRKRVERERLSRATASTFDAAAVLLAIKSGAIPPGEAPAHRDAVRLLERACQAVIAARATVG